MVLKIGSTIVLFLLGLTYKSSVAQDLVTECWSSDWVKYLEKCYLVVKYQHSWTKANEYCTKYGARLVEPTGHRINEQISTLVKRAQLEDFWIGYNIRGINRAESHKGFWSDGRPTSVKVGVWGQNQPDPDDGECTYVKTSTEGNRWYTVGCERVMPFVCEMDPCPTGMFQCSGRCISRTKLCDGTNDCGDNRDELNCPEQCTYTYRAEEGTIIQETTNGKYKSMANCQWTIETKQSTRVSVRFDNFETEENTDFLEIWNGGFTIGSSSIVTRLSGSLSHDQMTFTSSENSLIFRFLSDASVEKQGFALSWSTDYLCTYKTVPSFTFSNTEIQEGNERRLGGRQTYEKCEEDCDNSETCYGFTYFSGSNSCKFFSAIPNLAADDGATLYMKTCPPYTTLEASGPVPVTSLTATSEIKQLSTLLYPLPYMGDTESVYSITAPGNNIITLDILDIELCCGDTVEIFDGTAATHTLIEALTSTSEPHILMSTSPNVYIKMTLNTHLKCRGMLINFNKGCDKTLTETGTLTSPGFDTTIGYPGVMECTWTLVAPSPSRSITVVFEECDLEQDKDFLTISTADGSSVRYTGTELMTDKSHTANNYMTLRLVTSALNSARGFKASFSPGCSTLESDSVILDSNSHNYLDIVKMSCAEGYFFEGELAGETEVTLQCGSGGVWNVTSASCARGYCGPPPLIHNGYIVSGGVQGRDTATYMCDAGFTLHGSLTINCNATGHWEMPPTCTSDVCLPISNVTSGLLDEIIHGDGSQVGSVARLACPTYSEIHGAATVKCVNGAWDFANGEATICHSKPCAAPLIDNAYLTPQQPYVLNQALTVICSSGYRIVGDSRVNCGVTEPLPSCEKMQCTLNFGNVVPVASPGVTGYSYGESVLVKCSPHYEFNEFHRSKLLLTCLSTGLWDIQPTCRRIACGVPQQIKGAVYTPSTPCLDHGCNFTVSCKDKYQLEGATGSNDDIVICGLTDDGLWSFGDFRCIGGQCSDLANIPSGTLAATSFQEGSVATFTCKTGYAPVPPDPIVCEYNEIAGEMQWSPSTLPRCVDVLDPVISNCPPAPIEISYMQPAGFVEPTAADNTGVKSFEITPINYQNFHPYQPIDRAVRFTYKATDFEGRTSTCNVSIYIPDFITCSNKLSLEYLVQRDETIDKDMLLRNRYIEDRTQNAFLFISPETIQVEADSSMLQRIDQIDVTARDTDGIEVETCRLQFRYKGYKCRNWGIHIPGGGSVQCIQGIQSSTCHAYCNTGLYFMEAPDTSSIELTCNEVENEGEWNRDPPVCAAPSASFVAYTAAFDYTYSIENGIVSSWTDCAEVYKAELENAYPVLQITLQTVCDSNNQDNPVTLRIRDMTPQSLSYNQGANQSDPISLSVRLEVFIDLQDETVDNVLDLKDNCASLIMTQFNTNTSAIASIWRVDGQSFPSTCGRGTYEHFSGSVNKYDCEGSRKYALINGEPTCLSCPLGYDLNVTTENCSPCPDGTYGVYHLTGPMCSDCPGRVGPGKTALTSEEQCSIPGICPPGYYSDDGLTPCTPCPKNFYSLSDASQTCAACPSDKVTRNTGSNSVSMCLSLDELGSEESPCTPNPCHNNSTCSLQRSDFFCTCAPGYTGRRCITPFNACSSQPCKNDQSCIPGDGDSFSCQCSHEFEGDLCEIDIANPCSNLDLCENNGTCHNQIGSHSCVCPAAGGFSNIDGTCGTPIDQCETNKCQEGSCIAHGSYYRSCDCYPGFTGIDCEINIDDCYPNPCKNGGACVDGVDSFNCTCGSGFHGDFCQFEKACDNACGNSNIICHNCPADKTDRCENFGNGYICHCKAGYTGTHCDIPDNACREYPCEHGGTCRVVSEDPGYNCECSEPWTGANCEREKSNCPVGDKCFNEGICYSTSSGFQCSCTSQFIGPSCNISYDLCGRVNACLGEGSDCSYTEEQGFQCSCGPGLSGDSCQTPDPTCSPDYCYNGGTCDDITGSLKCSCKIGYEGPRCETNTDDCSPDLCPQNANQQCIDGVNTYVCDCANGKRGENCDKDIGDFDYSIEAPQNCLLNEDVASFGNGSTVINEMSVAFWCRYTQKRGRGTILNIYGSVPGDQVLPGSPDFMWRFDATEVTVGMVDNNKRKKRAERSAEYGVDIANGFWHHIVMTWTWSTQQGHPEMTLYVDGEYRDQLVETQPSITSANFKKGFVVFGDYDPNTGAGDADNSMQGRLSRLYVMEGVLDQPYVEQLYGRTNNQLPYGILLHQENNLMLQYTVDYNSEVTQGICVPPNVQNCQGLYTAGDMPEVSNCEDILAVTDRAASPAWPSPAFTNTNPDTRVANRISEGGPLDWDVYGVSIAEYAPDNSSAAVCTFRLYNYPTGCTNVTSEDASCTSENGDLRCYGSCNSNEQLTGSNGAYQTCSKYSMWDEALRQEPYNYAACSSATPVKYLTRIALTVTIDSADCESISNNFITNYQRTFNDFDSKVNGGLCGGSCGSLLDNTFSCMNNTNGELRVDFGLLSGEISFESQMITPAEAMKVAVADESVFNFEQSPGGPSVTPDLRSLMIDATAACDPGSQVSGSTCVQCGSGTFYDATTSTCKRCPKGEYRDITDGDTTPTSPCKPCLPRTTYTTASDGSPSSSYCKFVCLQGWYFSEAVGPAGECTQCPIGFYQPVTGQFSCLPCESDKTTDDVGKIDITDCVLPESITTTPASTVAPVTPGVGAATEQSGLSTGVIVAVVLGVIIAILIIFLLVCFCCFKCQVPCLAKKTQEVTPEEKGRYYVDKYGENKMHFVNRNLADLREKKGRPLDKEPFVETPVSEESGSVKNDISIHVPVFLEKLDGSVSKKNVYMSDSIKIETPSHTQRLPMTSSPRANVYHDINFRDERKHKKKRRKRSKKPAELDDALPTQNGQIPKALAPMPQKLRSMPPEDIHLRPSSALERPREKVAPSHYEDILTPTSSQQAYKPHSSIDTGSKQVYVSERGLIQAPPPERGTRSPPSPELEMNHYEDYRYPMKRIEVESDQEDLR